MPPCVEWSVKILSPHPTSFTHFLSTMKTSTPQLNPCLDVNVIPSNLWWMKLVNLMIWVLRPLCFSLRSLMNSRPIWVLKPTTLRVSSPVPSVWSRLSSLILSSVLMLLWTPTLTKVTMVSLKMAEFWTMKPSPNSVNKLSAKLVPVPMLLPPVTWW